MKIIKVAENMNVKPTKRKIKQAEKLFDTISGLPKEMPIEKKVYFRSESDIMESVKDKIQISIDNMQDCFVKGSL